MEGWKVGEIHGSFEIITSLADVHANIAQARIGIILWTVGIFVMIYGVVWLLVQKSVVRPLQMASTYIRRAYGINKMERFVLR